MCSLPARWPLTGRSACKGHLAFIRQRFAWPRQLPRAQFMARVSTLVANSDEHIRRIGRAGVRIADCAELGVTRRRRVAGLRLQVLVKKRKPPVVSGDWGGRWARPGGRRVGKEDTRKPLQVICDASRGNYLKVGQLTKSLGSRTRRAPIFRRYERSDAMPAARMTSIASSAATAGRPSADDDQK
jgi:hypothetical protein